MNNTNHITASIIIITKNQKLLLEQSIQSIKKQKSKHKFEIIVVDSGSTDGAVGYLRGEKIKLIQIKPEEFGYAKAFNIGAAQALGKYLIRLSGDAIPLGQNWLEELINPFENPSVGAVYGKYIISGKPGFIYPNFWSAEMFPDSKVIYSVKPGLTMGMFEKKPLMEKINRLRLLAGGCYSIRKEIWKSRKPNESIIGGEDMEYSLFLHMLGYDVVYNPMVVVLHEHAISHNRPSLWSYFMYIGISKWQFILYWELIKLWVERFLLHKYDSLIINRTS